MNILEEITQIKLHRQRTLWLGWKDTLTLSERNWYKVSQVGGKYKQGPRGWKLGARAGNSKKQSSDNEAPAKAVRRRCWMFFSSVH